nr:uncharacterized protein LOC128702493 isoform X2 [Cherax quadricarinatus]
MKNFKYVTEDNTYWVPAGWPVGTGGMMEDSLASPGGEDSVSSPTQQEEASTSASKQRPDSKKCGVCGDRALGYNFNAITCESCKAFFRRNAIKNKDFRCPFEDRCNVTQVTRRFCQKCRLRKCFEIGMKKEWIMTEEEKQRKKQKIEENRARKMGDAISDDENGKSSNPFSPFTAAGGSECSKPQAVVVGVIRSDEDTFSKVMRVEGQTDVHSQDRMIIQSTGIAAQRLPLTSSFNADNVNYSVNYANSPSPEHQGAPPPYSTEQEYSSGSLLSPSPAPVSTERLHSDEILQPFSPALTVCDRGTSLTFTDPKEQSNDNTDSTEVESQKGKGKSARQILYQLGQLSPTSHHVQGSLAHVMAINIKKEVEYQDDVPQSPQQQQQQQQQQQHQQQEQPQQQQQQQQQEQKSESHVDHHHDDTWQNFSIHEALAFLQPGCKLNLDATGLTMMDSIMNTAISAEYSAFSLLASNNPRELNEPEKLKLNELSEANKGLMAPLCEDYNFKDLSNPSLINIINLTEIAIRRLIKMSKRISAFKSLCQEDQIALLKGGCTEMMILRSVCAYDPDKDSWMIQQDHDRFKNIKLKVLKAAPGNVYEEHKRFILAFQPEWRRDHNIIFLLSAITLFSPERPNILHADAIRHEQCSYLYLLKRYLECKYGGCEGRTVYHRLLERVTHLHILSENHIRVFLEVNPQEVEPLLIEIFDLKQR